MNNKHKNKKKIESIRLRTMNVRNNSTSLYSSVGRLNYIRCWEIVLCTFSQQFIFMPAKHIK